MPLSCFQFQDVDCLLSRTRVSDAVEKGIEAPTVQDMGTDTSMGASGRKLKTSHSAPPGPSQTSQNNDVDIINNEETPAFF